MIRAIPLRHYLTLMQARGHASESVLRGTSILAEELTQPGQLISLRDYKTVVDTMLTLDGDKGLGLDVGLDTEVCHLGTLGYAALSCRNVRQVIEEVWGKYASSFGVMGEIRIQAATGSAIVFDIMAPFPAESAFRFWVEEALTFFLKIGASVTGMQPRLRRLQFSYPEPGYSQRYHDLFACPVQFDECRTCATIEGGWLDEPFLTSDQELNALCSEHLRTATLRIDASESMVMRLRDILLQRQDRRFCLVTVADLLGVSPRTLERQLQEEGHSFRQIVEESRLALARAWLISGAVPPKEVSVRLGFSDVSTFRRAFKTWTGQTISAFRASQLSAVGTIAPRRPSGCISRSAAS